MSVPTDQALFKAEIVTRRATTPFVVHLAQDYALSLIYSIHVSNLKLASSADVFKIERTFGHFQWLRDRLVAIRDTATAQHRFVPPLPSLEIQLGSFSPQVWLTKIHRGLQRFLIRLAEPRFSYLRSANRYILVFLTYSKSIMDEIIFRREPPAAGILDSTIDALWNVASLVVDRTAQITSEAHEQAVSRPLSDEELIDEEKRARSLAALLNERVVKVDLLNMRASRLLRENHAKNHCLQQLGEAFLNLSHLDPVLFRALPSATRRMFFPSAPQLLTSTVPTAPIASTNYNNNSIPTPSVDRNVLSFAQATFAINQIVSTSLQKEERVLLFGLEAHLLDLAALQKLIADRPFPQYEQASRILSAAPPAGPAAVLSAVTGKEEAEKRAQQTFLQGIQDQQRAEWAIEKYSKTCSVICGDIENWRHSEAAALKHMCKTFVRVQIAREKECQAELIKLLRLLGETSDDPTHTRDSRDPTVTSTASGATILSNDTNHTSSEARGLEPTLPAQEHARVRATSRAGKLEVSGPVIR